QRAAARFGEDLRRARFCTFHSFCYKLLSEQAPRKALDKYDQWIFLRRHLEELKLDYYFKVSDPGRFLEDLVDFCSRCHDNLVSPADFSAYIERLAADCRQRQAQGKTSEECDEKELNRLREVARVFALLEQLQEREGFLSYGGMISRAIELLDSSPALLRRLQQRYRFLLVDEFQDTNTAQFELLVRLAGEKANLTVVGDDDQAIYRFRGASYASFQQFADRYPEHLRVVLDRNYRSTPRILTVAGAALASNSRDRFQPDKKLITDKPSGPAVEIWEFPDSAAQAEYTAQRIARLVREERVAAYSDFAVLYRAHLHRAELVAALRRYGVPFAIRNLAITNFPVARDVIAILRVIGDSRDSVSLARVLADPRWKLRPDQFIGFCRQANRNRVSLAAIIDQGAEQHVPSQEWSARDVFVQFRDRYRALAKEQRLTVWFPLLLRELGLPRRPEERRVLRAFSEFLSRWDGEKSATGLLHEFLEYFAYFEEAFGSISLTDEAVLPSDHAAQSSQARLWEDEIEESVAGKVQLMTVHGAKGLEFEHVQVLHLVKRAFPTTHRPPLISLPAALWKGPLPRGDFHLEEDRRLFYVALTRARQSLVLSTISNQRQRPSIFLDELAETSPPDLVRKKPILPSAGPPRPPAPAQPASRLEEWVATPVALSAEDFALSASQLQTYLECPLKYQFRHVWRVPVPPTPPLLFGLTLHAAVKDAVSAVVREGGAPAKQAIQRILEQHWPVSGFADAVQERRYREMGLEQLEGVCCHWSGQKFELLHQEKPFELRLGGCKVVGRMDQVHRMAGGAVELIEYKTGKPKTSREVDRSP
ncbi:MAG TPA: ATP-dependent DNA helicase, partial [Terriglobia bacterium]